MTSVAGGPDWEVRLSNGAEETLRGMEPVVRRRAARALDRLQREGLSAGTGPVDATGAGLTLVQEGPVKLRVAFSPESRTALVVDIESNFRSASTPRLLGAFQDLASDVRIGARGLLLAPAFSLAVLLTLWIGFGGSTAILGLANTVYRSALPFEDGEQLVRLRTFANTESGRRVYNMSPRDFHAVREENQVFSGVVAMAGGSVGLLGDEGADRVSAVEVSRGWGSLLGIRPAMGRLFTADEEAQGADSRVALVSHGVWDRFLDRDPDLVGKTLTTTGGPLEIVGVLTPGFAYPYDAGIWTPGEPSRSEWQGHDLNVVGRLNPGVTLARARLDMTRLFDQLKAASPGIVPDDGVNVVSSRDDLIRDSADALKGLTAAVLFLLLLAFANVGNLLTIRLVDREREATLRAVLGASKARLVRLAMVEAILLFAVGGLGSLVVASVLAKSAGALIPDVLRTQLNLGEIRLEALVLAGTMAVAVVAGLTTGAIAAIRSTKRDLQSAMRQSGRGSPGRGTGRIQNGLVIAEVSLALVLLVGAGALLRHFQTLRTADLGYETEDRVTIQLVLNTDRYSDPAVRSVFIETIEERVRRLPEVVQVGITSVNPLCCGDWGGAIRVEGLERPPDAPPLLIHHGYVSPTYFETMGMPLIQGRNMGLEDRPETLPVVVVDEALASRFWPGEDPIGKRVGLAREGSPLRTVVGVVPRSTREGDYTESWYLPLLQEPTGRSAEIVHLMIHHRDPDALGAVRRAIAEVDPSVATFGGATLSSLRDEVIGQDRVGAVLAASFAGVGLLLACLGLYGLLAYRVALQTRELGTRMALGARAGQVVAFVLGRSVRLLVAGIALGTLGGVAVNRLLQRTIVGVEMASPLMIVGLVGLLSAAAVVAAIVPAFRAARLDPARTVQG